MQTKKTPQEKNGLKAEDISLIIQSCEKAKVLVLKYDGLHIEFSRQAEAPQDAAPAPYPAVAEITDIQKRESEKSLLSEELDLKDDQLAEMWITDPHAAEQLVINDQLEESSNGAAPEET